MLYLLLIAFYRQLLHFLEEHMLMCPSVRYLHMECPGCGLQRSCLALLRGEWRTSLSLYPAALPIIGMLLFLMLHLKYNYAKGALVLRGIFLFCVSVILVHYIYKVTTHQVILN